MDDIFEFLFELIIEGAMGAVKDKELPLVIRIVASLILTVIYGGLLLLLFVVAREILLDGGHGGVPCRDSGNHIDYTDCVRNKEVEKEERRRTELNT